MFSMYAVSGRVHHNRENLFLYVMGALTSIPTAALTGLRLYASFIAQGQEVFFQDKWTYFGLSNYVSIVFFWIFWIRGRDNPPGLKLRLIHV